ncbi:hypothetical protein N5E84_00065 [Vibrio sp. J502]|nr:hypothetical protein N5E84_00065 [Vibrio sp. J502]
MELQQEIQEALESNPLLDVEEAYEENATADVHSINEGERNQC